MLEPATPTRSGKAGNLENSIANHKPNKNEDSTQSNVGWEAKRKGKRQENIPHHLDKNSTRNFQLRYDIRLKLNSILGEIESKIIIVEK